MEKTSEKYIVELISGKSVVLLAAGCNNPVVLI